MSGSAHRGISDAGRPQSITAADPVLGDIQPPISAGQPAHAGSGLAELGGPGHWQWISVEVVGGTYWTFWVHPVRANAPTITTPTMVRCIRPVSHHNWAQTRWSGTLSRC